MIKQPSGSELVQAIELGEKFWKETEHSQYIPYDQASVYDVCKEADKQDMMYVYVADGRVVGFAVGMIYPFPFNSKVKIGTEIAWYVDPDYRGESYGVELLLALEGEARNQKCTSHNMVLLESVCPKQAESIYKRLGYSPTERTYTKVF